MNRTFTVNEDEHGYLCNALTDAIATAEKADAELGSASTRNDVVALEALYVRVRDAKGHKPRVLDRMNL